MIVGVDGGAVSIVDDRLKTGVYKITKRILENISHIDYSINYRIYTMNRRGEGNLIQPQDRVQLINVLPKMGWQKIALPIELIRHPVDIYLGLSQSIPYIPKFLSKSHNIGFLYDLGFIKYPGDYPDSYTRLINQTRHLVKTSDRIITISNSVKADICKYYQSDPNIITVAYPGVDDTFKNKGLKRYHNKPYFLYTGALKPGKNIPKLIEAYHDFISSTRKDIDLMLVGGDFWKDPEIDRTIQNLKIYDRVIKTGYISDNDLAKYYRGALCLVTLSDHEGFCLPAVEAMSCGCPVIASKKGATPEIVKNAGIFVNSQNKAEIVDAMKQMIIDRRRKILSENGIRSVSDYNWTNFILTVYKVIKMVEKQIDGK